MINLVGILTEAKPRQAYRAVHVDGARIVARAAARSGVKRVIHVSALGGASRGSPAQPDRTKAEDKEAVRAAFPAATIVQPSLVYGPDDHFFNGFAAIAERSPVLPLIGGGRTRFQLHVDDLARAIARALLTPEPAACTYEAGGAQLYSFRELLECLLQALGRRRLLLSILFRWRSCWRSRLNAFCRIRRSRATKCDCSRPTSSSAVQNQALRISGSHLDARDLLARIRREICAQNARPVSAFTTRWPASGSGTRVRPSLFRSITHTESDMRRLMLALSLLLGGTTAAAAASCLEETERLAARYKLAFLAPMISPQGGAPAGTSSEAPAATADARGPLAAPDTKVEPGATAPPAGATPGAAPPNATIADAPAPAQTPGSGSSIPPTEPPPLEANQRARIEELLSRARAAELAGRSDECFRQLGEAQAIAQEKR